MPDESGVTVVTTLVCFYHFAREAAGASRIRRFLRPLFFGREVKQNSDALRREKAESYSEFAV